MWNLYQNNKFLEPLKFSNGKSQADVVREVLESVEKGNKIIFIRGVCGTGKSAIALNIARKLGKASIVVPGKNLQSQYKEDYEENKYLFKEGEKKLTISVMTGRNNHACKFLEANQLVLTKERREINSKLNDIFEFSQEERDARKKADVSADNWHIPCKIEIKEKNWNKIKQYLKENKNINPTNFNDIKDVKRVSIAGVCPYWSPVLPAKYEPGGTSFENAIKKTYTGLDGTKFVFYQRRPGCKFYEQFNSFINSDVIVFNSLKYKLESALNRKPETEVEIIDECDEFLDSFSNQRTINLDRLLNSLVHVWSNKEIAEKIVREISSIIKEIKRDKNIEAAVYSKKIVPLKETLIRDLMEVLLKNPEFFDEIDDESYLFDVEETAKMFEDFHDDSYLIFSKKDGNLSVSIVTTNLAKKFKEMVDKNKIVVLMSGTIHSEDVLTNIFGLSDFKIIDAETEQQGEVEIKESGLEMDCRYSNLRSGEGKRKQYLLALDKCVEIAEKPTLIHINSFADLPSEVELAEYELKHLVNREKVRQVQIEDKTGAIVRKFKEGKIHTLFSTRCARGIDFPGSQCRSIIFTKYPNPDIQAAFWKILKQTQPAHYWSFYRDKARRELLQKMYRGLRFKEDHIYLLSPDIRVLDAFRRI